MKKLFAKKSKEQIEETKIEKTIPTERSLVDVDYNRKKLFKKGINLMADEKLEEAIPTTLVWKELDEPRQSHVLVRGQYDQLGDIVQRAHGAAGVNRN